MTDSQSFSQLLENYALGNQSDCYLRGVLALGKLLADELESSGASANPVDNVNAFLGQHLDDPYLLELVRQRTNHYREKYARGG